MSMGIWDLGPFKPILKSKVLGLVPDLVVKLRTTPVRDPKLELQLVAHDGSTSTSAISIPRRHLNCTAFAS